MSSTREAHTQVTGTHTSGKYYCLHTSVWPAGTVTADTVLANPFDALYGGVALGINSMQVFTWINTWNVY